MGCAGCPSYSRSEPARRMTALLHCPARRTFPPCLELASYFRYYKWRDSLKWFVSVCAWERKRASGAWCRAGLLCMTFGWERKALQWGSRWGLGGSLHWGGLSVPTSLRHRASFKHLHLPADQRRQLRTLKGSSFVIPLPTFGWRCSWHLALSAFTNQWMHCDVVMGSQSAGRRKLGVQIMMTTGDGIVVDWINKVKISSVGKKIKWNLKHPPQTYLQPQITIIIIIIIGCMS